MKQFGSVESLFVRKLNLIVVLIVFSVAATFTTSKAHAAGTARVRFLYMGSESLQIEIESSESGSKPLPAIPVKSGELSNYTTYAPGSYNVSITTTNGFTSSGIEVTAGQDYLVLLAGQRSFPLLINETDLIGNKTVKGTGRLMLLSNLESMKTSMLLVKIEVNNFAWQQLMAAQDDSFSRSMMTARSFLILNPGDYKISATEWGTGKSVVDSTPVTIQANVLTLGVVSDEGKDKLKLVVVK